MVSGSLRATDTLYSTTAQFQILRAPTASNGTTYGPGTANNLLKSNGTSVYWTTLATSDIPTISITDKTSGTLTVARGRRGATDAAGARKNLGVKVLQSNVSSPTANGNSISYIDTISQNTQGVISATKKTIPEVTQSEFGLMIPDDKIKLDNIGIKKQVKTVSIEPVQDLHGYENPWPAGGGKNKLKNSLTSGNINGLTVAVDADGVISFSGTATETTVIKVNANIDTEFSKGISYILSGCTGGSLATYRFEIYKWVGNNVVNYNGDTQFQFYDTDSGCVCRIVILSGINMSGVKIYPMIRLATETDATYAPCSNICPISGWTGANVTRTGKNLLDKTTVESGFIASATGNVVANANYRHTDYIPMRAGQTYYISGTTWTGSNSGAFYNSNKEYVGELRITANNREVAPSVDGYARFSLEIADVDTAQLELGSTATAYEPYQGTSYNITFPSEAGTVYGGTLDVTTGLLTVTMAEVDLGTLTWTLSNISPAVTSGIRIKATLSGAAGAASSVKANAVCSAYSIATGSQTYSGTTGLAIDLPTSGNAVQIFDSAYSDLSTFAASLSGVDLVYELATPQTYQLSPTQIMLLAKTDNVWADCGDITLQSCFTNNAANITGIVAIEHGGTGATTASDARANLEVPSLTGSGASGTWGINVTGSAQTVKGTYTSSGGQQNPNYFGTNKVGFLMMNTTVNGNGHYKDWLIMDCYNNNDVGGSVAFGVNRQALGAYIMRSEAARSSWAESAELLGTHNYTYYCPTKTGDGASGTWGININGNAGSATYASSYLASRGTVSGSSHAEALKAYFNSYKASEPRNALIAHYSSAYDNGSLCMGYFLNSHDSNPYGGFFVANYDTPYYVGISNGSYTQQTIYTSNMTIPISNGGTGATTAAGARANLEITPANISALYTGHLSGVNLDNIVYNFLGTVWNFTGTGVSHFGSQCGTLICTDIDSFGTSGSRVRQIFMNFFGNDIWTRIRTDTTWSAWKCLAQNNANVGASIALTSNDTTAELLYNKLKDLDVNYPASIRVDNNPIQSLTGQSISGGYGTVVKIGVESGTLVLSFDICYVAGNYRHAFTTRVSQSAITPGAVYRYTGTAVS